MIHSPKVKRPYGGAPTHNTDWTLDAARERIEWEVKQSKGSLRYCAWRLGVSPTSLSRVRTGHLRPSPKMLAAMGWESIIVYRPKNTELTPGRTDLGRVRGDYWDKLKRNSQQQSDVMTAVPPVQENPLSTNGGDHGSDQQERDLLPRDDRGWQTQAGEPAHQGS